MQMFLSPVRVESLAFKNKKEISDFGDLEENRHVRDLLDSLKINESGSGSDYGENREEDGCDEESKSLLP
jgi:hypothetical protein